ncbi:hypothetical protein V6N12_054213 [Hibiscus sabdariffa]|uniref:Zinc knuckle CX2CX4HX4C domain-containing protein n=1 Tax=Hibiscus sabdariffa TaxID=183260 RepID=A0ABR2CZR1_9ROSI
MAVSINLRKPLVSKFLINGHLQLLEYESLPTFCFHCGIYSHLKDICLKLHALDGSKPMQPGNTASPSPVQDNHATADPFSPWMLSVRRADASSSKDMRHTSIPISTSKFLLDRLKHQRVQLVDDSHPPIPIDAIA